MPELPEVETICRSLTRHLTGAVIRTGEILGKLRLPIAQDELSAFCAGQTITDITRRGKYILVRFTAGNGLILHLGMTGSFAITPDDGIPQPHERIAWQLADGRRWRFCDPRRFGCVAICHEDILACRHPRLARLAVEPLSNDFSPEYLYGLSRNRTAAIKNIIMDQSNLVGVGNIYASEALFATGIAPATPAGRLSRPQCRRLTEAIQQILRQAIIAGGTTISDFHDVNGEEGHFRVDLQVYGRAGQPCLRCGTTIVRQILGGRSSFFCPHCQPKKREANRNRPAPPSDHAVITS